MKKPTFHLDLKPSDFEPADIVEKQSLVVMRPSVSFWKEGFKRLSKNKVAMVSLVVIILVMIFAFIGPEVYPYSYEQQIRGSENLKPMQFSADEIIMQNNCVFLGWSKTPNPMVTSKEEYDKVEFVEAEIEIKSNLTLYAVWGLDADKDNKADFSYEQKVYSKVTATPSEGGTVGITYNANNGEGELPSDKNKYVKGDKAFILENVSLTAPETKVFPHILGTDTLARDIMVRLMMGSRVSLIVGIIASLIILLIGSVYGAIAGYFGKTVDLVMMRIVDIIYTIPDILIIILLIVTLKHPLKNLADNVKGFGWINIIGVPLICIFIVFALLYWVGMARIVRGQILSLKEQEYITAARALGAGHSRIIRKHLLTNCIGTLIVTTTLQIPSSIFTESFLSFIGIGVNAPMPSLGSMASTAIGGINSYPHRLLAPAIMISLIILSFNLLGDGLRDAFDPKLKH